MTIAVEAGAKIGTFSTSEVDFVIPVAGGPPIRVSRTYDTSLADQSGDFGYGWSYCFNDPRIVESVPRGEFENLLGQFAAIPFRDGDRSISQRPIASALDSRSCLNCTKGSGM